MGQNGAIKWPNGQHGLCGDPAGGPQRFMQPGAVGGEPGGLFRGWSLDEACSGKNESSNLMHAFPSAIRPATHNTNTTLLLLAGPRHPTAAAAATYKQGQVIDVHFFLSTNHYGRIEFRLCPISATSQSACTKLQR